MINRLSNLINRNRSAAKISQVLCSTGYRIMETYLGEGEGLVFTDFTESGKSIFVRKLSCVVVGTFKACNFVRLSSRPACPWGCTPTNRLYCRDMT